MFLIANASRKEIVISDLGLTLSARQAIDLHKIKTQIPPEQSKDLQNAKAHGAIKILHQETSKNITKERDIFIKESFNKDELLKDIKILLGKEIDKKINSSQSSNNAQITEMLNMMHKLVQNNQSSGTSTADGDSDIDIGQSQLVDIHSRSLNTMSKNVLGSKLTSEEEVKDSRLSDNIDELSQML